MERGIVMDERLDGRMDGEMNKRWVDSGMEECGWRDGWKNG